MGGWSCDDGLWGRGGGREGQRDSRGITYVGKQ